MTNFPVRYLVKSININAEFEFAPNFDNQDEIEDPTEFNSLAEAKAYANELDRSFRIFALTLIEETLTDDDLESGIDLEK